MDKTEWPMINNISQCANAIFLFELQSFIIIIINIPIFENERSEQ